MARTKGSPNLTRDKKAKIIATKNLGLHTVDDLAKNNNISVETVYRVARDRDKDPTLEPLIQSWQERIIRQSKINIGTGLEVIGKRIVDPEESLTAITNAVKVSHDIYRLETHQPTSINSRSAEEIVLDYIRVMMRRGASAERIATFVRKSTVLREDCRVPDEVCERMAQKVLAGEVSPG